MQLDLDIHNFYEHLVVEHLEDNKYSRDYEKEFLADLCCLALTQLPARYIRHDIDMAFFLNADERKQMSEEVEEAIALALSYLKSKGED
ncbi:competence protein ComFB ['Osedax' symbiont bacterium Rs2_46_30_T18]|nr:competence protein ComFB ['Osedax' symbiont bacterium Rs2_46_30_T18]